MIKVSLFSMLFLMVGWSISTTINVYPSSADGSVKLLDDERNPLSDESILRAGERYYIAVTPMDKIIDQAGITSNALLILQIEDDEGFTLDLSWITVDLQEEFFYIDWIPKNQGQYSIKTFIWDKLENPVALYHAGGLAVKVGAISDMTWTNILGNVGDDSAYSAAELSDGGLVIVGRTNSHELTFGDYDGIVTKLDIYGKVVWSKHVGGSSPDMLFRVIETSDGNILAVGRTLSFGPSPGANYLVVKLAGSDGSMLFMKAYGSLGYESAYDVEEDSEGYIIGGWNHGANAKRTNNVDSEIFKIEKADGSLIWARVYGRYGSSPSFPQWVDDLYEVKKVNDGYIIAGWTHDGSSIQNYDLWLMKLDFNFDVLWSRAYGGSADEAGQSGVNERVGLSIASDGGFIISSSTISFGSDREILIMKTDPSGNIEWSRTVGSSAQDGAVAVQAYNNIAYIGGFIEREPVIIAFYENGTYKWAKKDDSMGSGQVNDIKLTSDGRLLVTGFVRANNSNDISVAKLYESELESTGIDITVTEVVLKQTIITIPADEITAFEVIEGGLINDAVLTVSLTADHRYGENIIHDFKVMYGNYNGNDHCFNFKPTIMGTEGSDVLTGTRNDDIINGLGGDDVIYGLEGNDIICGGAGRDRIFADPSPGAGVTAYNDQVYGGSGGDHLLMGLGNDIALGGPGADEIGCGPDSGLVNTFAANDNDICYGEFPNGLRVPDNGKSTDPDTAENCVTDVCKWHVHEINDELFGWVYGDKIGGGDGDDVIYGSDWGRDRLYGDAGNDEIYGLAGDDDPQLITTMNGPREIGGTLQGNMHDDQIYGGDGNDQIIGGVEPPGNSDYGDGGSGVNNCSSLENAKNC